jgi:ATP-binding cassette, subfamily C, bacterial
MGHTDIRLRSGFRLFQTYRVETVAIVVGMLLASLTEGVGIVTIIAALGVLLQTEGSVSSPAIVFLLGQMKNLGIEPNLAPVLVFALMLIGFRAVLLIVTQSYAAYVRGKVEETQRFSLVESVMRARWEFFISIRLGRFSNALNQEAGRVSGMYAGLIRLIAMTLNLIAYFAVAIVLSWELAFAAIVSSVTVLLVFKKFVSVSKNAGRQQTKSYREMSSRFTDGLLGIKSLKAMGLDRLLTPILNNEVVGLRRAQLRASMAKLFVKNAMEPLTAVIVVTGLIAAVRFLAIDATVLIGMVLVFHRAVGTVGNLQQSYMGLVALLPFLDSFWSLVQEAKKNDEKVIAHRYQHRFLLEEGVILDDVSFSYANGKQILKDVSMRFRRGEITAITGASGSGKTTIGDLICGLLRPTAGSIRLDREKLEGGNIAAWRSQIGYIQQDPLLFHDSIFANVALRDPEISAKDVEDALSQAGATDFVKGLPGQCDTIVGERGVALSGGQRQRIAIARALARKPAILILDEATTGLDSDTEAGIITTLTELKKNLCIVVISHQLPIVAIADRTYRIEQGRVQKPSS